MIRSRREVLSLFWLFFVLVLQSSLVVMAENVCVHHVYAARLTYLYPMEAPKLRRPDQKVGRVRGVPARRKGRDVLQRDSGKKAPN
jgi:hypothetical protein